MHCSYLEKFSKVVQILPEWNDEIQTFLHFLKPLSVICKISENLEFRGIYKFTDSKLHYDAVRSTFNQIDNSSHEKDSSATLNFTYKPIDKLKSNLYLQGSPVQGIIILDKNL